MAKYHHATRAEVCAIGDELKKYCVKLPDNYCEYREGKTDQGIATFLNVSLNSVRSQRTEMFGRLKAPNFMSGGGFTVKNELAALRAEIEDLKAKHNALTLALGVREYVVPLKNGPLDSTRL